MKKNIPISLLLLIISLGSITAQTFVGKINPFPQDQIRKSENDDTLKILAVMAEFQVDEDNATFGDGTFGSIYTQDYGTDIIDPLPHDAEYFEDHLQFAKNYFKKVSGGKLIIDYKVVRQVVKLPLTMRNYSPNPTEPDNFQPLGEFCEAVWTSADNNQSIEFSDYDLFTIFHAGVGRDIQVPGSIGNDRDLPSVYLSYNALKNIFGDSFEGFGVNGDQFKITNTMILPETESRELSSFDETSLLELSINGLIVASIASHLGLPDLFDTNTGLSSIGRFGLMDGQSIFTFGGLFPPEPSPWEKIFLGWIEPVTISNTNTSVGLTAYNLAAENDTSLIKVPINSSEYYLIENRSRDANKDGCVVTYKIAGQTLTKTFDKDYNSFISYNIDTLSGVIIDVDEYDWAVPPFDRNTDDLESFSDVGIIIWHIDETVIRENLESNTINTDKFRKGVAVVEADGINDIGEEFQTVFGDVVIGEGSKEDTWYASNPSELYKNLFNDDTKPSAGSNTGANSLISISNFSDIDTRMSFDISFGTENVNLLSDAVLSENSADVLWLNSIGFEEQNAFYYSSNENVTVSNLNMDSFSNITRTIDYKPASFTHNNYSSLLFSNDREITLVALGGTGGKSFSFLKDSVKLTTPPAIKSVDNVVEFVIGNAEGFINVYELLSDASNTMNGIGVYSAFSDAVKQVAVHDDFIAGISNSGFWDIQNGLIELNSEPVKLLTTVQNSMYFSIVLLADNSISIISNGEIRKTIYLDNNLSIEGISLADIKGDGSNYILINTGEAVDAFNLTGGRAEYFPVDSPAGSRFVKTPLIVDLDSDNIGDVVAFTMDGRICAYSGLTGKTISPFPVSTGSLPVADPVIYSNEFSTSVLVLGDLNDIHLWSIAGPSAKQFWSGTLGGSFNSSFAQQAESINIEDEFFPKSKAYNWPNPVYNGETFFRFFVSEDSKVEINIFDLAGDLVEKLNENVSGGYDNEIAWNVANIQSGVYFAHLSIEGTSGKSDYKIIKVAVIK